MRFFNYLIIFQLLFCSVFSAYATTANPVVDSPWHQVGSAVRQGATSVYNGAKTAGGKAYTAVATITPSPKDVGKAAARAGAVGVGVELINQLLNATGWVMDPANNSIIFKKPDVSCSENCFLPHLWKLDDKYFVSGNEACSSFNMLHLITGTPGSGKTLYAVYLIDKQEISNKNALAYNAEQYKKNKKIIENNELYHYFNTHIYFSKITKAFETVFFEDDHFDYFLSCERKDNIFLDIKFYNDIIKKIKDELDVELKQLKSIRHIYANIDGLKVDNVRSIEIDWRKCPDGSVIFYDEIQLLDEYSNDNKKDEQNIIKHLTIHRHRAFDIYGITQFPRLVNTGFRDVVGLHYHLHRGWGAKSATVYVWANCREKPNSLGNKFTAERNFRFNYPRRLYEVYESATADTVRLRIPTKFLLLLLIPFFGVFLVFTTLNSDNNFFKTIFGSEQQEQQQVVKTQKTNVVNQEQLKNEVKKDDSTKSAEKTENEKLKEQVIELQKELEDLTYSPHQT